MQYKRLSSCIETCHTDFKAITKTQIPKQKHQAQLRTRFSPVPLKLKKHRR